MTDAAVFRGSGMTDHEIDTFLLEQGWGVLALADGGDAYAVPISFGYDTEGYCYVDLIQFGTDSRKLDVAAETATACLTVSEVESQFDWRSVVVFGTLETLPEEAEPRMKEVMEDNAWYPSLFSGTEKMTSVERFRLEVDATTGRKGEQRQ
jgi:nitroimidazol reductase NimA-like FMN-containing flavoprotein (pyridoxamine 5'-phosphate oxidase superfamily)